MSLRGITNFGDATVINQVRENLISMFDYGLLEKGAYINVEIPTTGTYGGNDHQLRLVNDPRYNAGQVWQSFRSNWVWESGLGALTSTDNAYPGVSGVYVNNTFYPRSTTGAYAHHINHPLGRVIFDTAIDTDSTVTCEYSYKYINVTRADGLEWFKQIQTKSERSDNTNFINNSGEWGILGDNRLQLPTIGVELVNSRKMAPHALGGGQRIYTDYLFHCVAEDAYTRDSLMDIVSFQNDKSIKSYDLNAIAANDAFPLDYRGVPVSGALLYDDIINTYEGRHIRLLNIAADSVYSMSPDIHIGTMKLTTEMIVFGV